MRRHRLSLLAVLGVQVFVVGAVAFAFVRLSDEAEVQFRETVLQEEIYPEVPIPREMGLVITPLYDDPSVVSHEDLARVLKKIRPKFPEKGRKPNFVEHALRAWGVTATFTDPQVMSGEQMRDFLLDHSRYAASWGGDDYHTGEPLLIDKPRGVAIRWESRQDTSVHHDHLLASLTEAGVPLSQRVYPPSGRQMNLNNVLQEALRDFRPEDRETEWSTMAFALWLPPIKSWQARGRTITFDMLAERLMRGQKEKGVCVGTHRVYSLMLLWRLDQEHDIITDETCEAIFEHLKDVRDLLLVSQFPDGHWPPNWPDGKAAVDSPSETEPHRNVIATGHHLEWLSIAPLELHPPREMVQKAARWLIEDTTSKSDQDIYDKFTFYSHVGNALALWRQTHPAEFWRTWTAAHPDFELEAPPVESPPPEKPADAVPPAIPDIPAPEPK
jgi:hypothetical protein